MAFSNPGEVKGAEQVGWVLTIPMTEEMMGGQRGFLWVPWQDSDNLPAAVAWRSGLD
jgi:hypothetical protein